jgi:phage N-6-adenine-methyltransferase
MPARPAIVQSVFEGAIREINALELRIVTFEDDADATLWEQARQVVEQLEAGLSQRALAAQWINVRTGEPYSHTHVQIVERVWRGNLNCQPRPRFRDAYNAITNAGSAHVSHNSGDNEWYTPREYIEAARQVLGAIDLDPASSDEAQAVVQAARYFTLADDGLRKRWQGRVWMNPPYSRPEIEHFVDKLAAAVAERDVSAAIVLVNNATETEWFATLGANAAAICFPTGRVQYWKPNAESATPLQGQAVIYLGDAPQAFARVFRSFGAVLFAIPEGA